MELKKKVCAVVASVMAMSAVGTLSASAYYNTFNESVNGTGTKTLLATATKMKYLDLYVSTCNITSFFSSDLDYELSAVYYSDTQSGKTGEYYYAPYNGTNKTYYLTAQCQGVTVTADIVGNYTYSTF